MEKLIKELLIKIGENVNREGLIETPKRVTKSLKFLCNGYQQNPKEILSKTFKQKYDEMVILENIEMYSLCEHHLLPFTGKAWIGYIPNGRVVGISKLARLLECFSRRLQIQERLTNQIADALEKHLKPKGIAVVIKAQHFCMLMRGIQKQNSVMTTSALRGVFKKEINARQEFLQLINK